MLKWTCLMLKMNPSMVRLNLSRFKNWTRVYRTKCTEQWIQSTCTWLMSNQTCLPNKVRVTLRSQVHQNPYRIKRITNWPTKSDRLQPIAFHKWNLFLHEVHISSKPDPETNLVPFKWVLNGFPTNLVFPVTTHRTNPILSRWVPNGCRIILVIF